ncbi:MAG TPA: VOC family protein [Jiangellaceae bacterium]|nr:VOC family protein [Jiangellaceae bacterium]
MQYRSAFPIIYSDDLGRALAFYRDALGFEPTMQFPSDGEPEFVSLELSDGTGVALAAPRGSSLHGFPLRPGSHAFEMCVYTDDVDAAVSDLRARGHEVLLEPVDQPWDERMAYVADPDGNAVMICARLRVT